MIEKVIQYGEWRRLNLNLGYSKIKDFESIDIRDCGQKYIYDLDNGLPSEINDNSCGYIRASHILEHLKDTRKLLNDCHRVLHEDGIMECWTPHCFWEGAHNPTHFQCITEFWFAFLRRGLEYGYGMKKWDILKLETLKNNEGVPYEVHCIMRPVK